jgi:hypothetical protein
MSTLHSYSVRYSPRQNCWYVADDADNGECVSGMYDTEDDARAELARMAEQ